MTIDLDAIRKRAEAATLDEWRVEEGTTLIWGRCDPDDHSTYGMGIPIVRVQPILNDGCRQHDEEDATATFIAHARTDIPALLSHITAQDAEHKAEMLGVIEFGCSYVRRFWTEKHFSEPLKSYDDILAAYLAQKEKKDV